jgi:hypothetical protein
MGGWMILAGALVAGGSRLDWLSVSAGPSSVAWAGQHADVALLIGIVLAAAGALSVLALPLLRTFAGPLGLAALLLAANDYATAQSTGATAPSVGLYLTAGGALLAVVAGLSAFKNRPLSYR